MNVNVPYVVVCCVGVVKSICKKACLSGNSNLDLCTHNSNLSGLLSRYCFSGAKKNGKERTF